MAESTGEQRSAPTVIYIGRKPTLVYAVATLMQLNQTSEGVTLKARGRSISRAVDTVEVLKRRFLGDKLMVRGIKLGTETMPPREGEGLRERNVSSMEISLGKVE